MERPYLMLLVILGIFVPLGFGLERCFDRYGCFNDLPPFNPLLPLPQSPSDVNTKYYLYTRANRIRGEEEILDDNNAETLASSHFDISRNRTILISHGWTENSSGYFDWMLRLKDALLDKDNFNVILIDWEKGAKQIYEQSTANTRLVGVMTAELINFLIVQGGNSSDLIDRFYFIGFSLGAQVAGYAGSHLQTKYRRKLPRITGLDPAGPYFTGTDAKVHLDKTDAEYVDIVHTNMPLIGTSDHVGHTDFFPNGGSLHPGCLNELSDAVFTIGCNHLRSTEFYIKSVKEDCPNPWVGHPCSSYFSYWFGNCNDCGEDGCPLLGYRAEESKLHGAYYLRTGLENEDTLCPKS
ncbi:pancreatic triacylglycerol lipase-like [Montipora capricornis]|uniref:pancreatic triacylglycerol lipase-like n=1 Tax=Montipora capricornis TaxID=246305 RepID=UPI0035F21C49